MNRFDCVFFDSGGTLYGVFDGKDAPTPEQVAEGRFTRVANALQAFGAEADPSLEKTLRELEAAAKQNRRVDHTYVRLMTGLIERLKLPLGSEVAACLADAYAGPRFRPWVFPGTHEMLHDLREAGVYLGVIANTAWPGFCMDRAFAGVGLLPYFRMRVYSGDEGLEKPDPAFFRLAERNSGQAGKRILYVGDSLAYDVDGAKAVGWSAALRRSKESTSQGRADFEFDHSKELAAYVLGR